MDKAKTFIAIMPSSTCGLCKATWTCYGEISLLVAGRYLVVMARQAFASTRHVASGFDTKMHPTVDGAPPRTAHLSFRAVVAALPSVILVSCLFVRFMHAATPVVMMHLDGNKLESVRKLSTIFICCFSGSWWWWYLFAVTSIDWQSTCLYR